jgi:L-lactate dehydrogenase complex protein LldG
MTLPSGARAEILNAIRRATPEARADRFTDYASIPRDYARQGQLDATDRLALFTDRLEHYDVGVHRASGEALSDVIAQACAARGKRRLVIPAGYPSAARPDGLELVPDLDLTYEDLDRSDGVLTMSTLAIALTGTIVLTHREDEGRRALTLIPDYHVCVVRADRVVETVPEAFRQLAALNPALVTTISGPSATADIEMIRVRGVHGPRTLDVIVVSG